MMLNNNEYTSSLVKVVSAGDLAEKNKQEKREEAAKKFFMVGAGIAVTTAASKLFAENETAQSWLDNKFKLKLLNSSISSTSEHEDFRSLKINPATGRAKIGFSDIALEGIRRLEEYSPFNILRTFDASHFMSPFTLGKDADVRISGDSVETQTPYFKKLLEKEGNHSFESEFTKHGFQVRDGSLFEVLDNQGTLGRKLLNEAYITSTHYNLPTGGHAEDSSYANKLLQKYANILGVDKEFSFDELRTAEQEQLTVVGGKERNALFF